MFLMNCFLHMKWFYLSFPTNFDMKSILSDNQLEVPFAWNALSHPFNLRLCLSLLVKCVFSQAKNSWIQSVSLCLLIRESRSLTFRAVIERHELKNIYWEISSHCTAKADCWFVTLLFQLSSTGTMNMWPMPNLKQKI